MRKEVISEVLLMNVEEAALSPPRKPCPFQPTHPFFLTLRLPGCAWRVDGGVELREAVMLPTVILFSEAAQIEVGWRFCSPWGSGRRGVWLAP